MNIEAFMLCDAATDQEGKLNVLGAFEVIYAKQMPAVHPACAIAARVRFEKIEQGDHPVRLNIINQDGKSIGPKLDANVSVRVSDDADSVVTNLVLNLQGLKFESYGNYRIDLAIDGQLVSSVPLKVIKPPNQT